MMLTVSLRSWKEEFERAAAIKRQERVREELDAAFERAEERRRKERKLREEREDRQIAELIFSAIAPPERVAEFRVQLDRYDAKTVEALMDNQEALDAVRVRIRDMLHQAHVLPDGRRVFLTRDERQVFDESGREVGPQEIDPATIDRKRPRWEDFAAAQEAKARLDEERKQLHDYQTKLDEARQRLDRGDITQADLDKLKDDLSASMPEAVRQKLDLEKQPKAEAEAAPSRDTPVLPADMDKLMRETGLGPGMTP